MNGTLRIDLGNFEGFNFREGAAIEGNLNAEDVIIWDHDRWGEAEFWPDGSNEIVSRLLPGNSCSAGQIRQVIRIFDELEGDTQGLLKAAYLRDRGYSLEDITREAIEDSFLHVFGPGYRADLKNEAAYELFETFWPEAYATWEISHVPGLHFDAQDFMDSFSTLQVEIGETWYLVVDTE